MKERVIAQEVRADDAMSAETNETFEKTLQNVESEEHTYNQVSQSENDYEAVREAATTESQQQYIELSLLEGVRCTAARGDEEADFQQPLGNTESEEKTYNELSHAERVYDAVDEEPKSCTNNRMCQLLIAFDACVFVAIVLMIIFYVFWSALAIRSPVEYFTNQSHLTTITENSVAATLRTPLVFNSNLWSLTEINASSNQFPEFESSAATRIIETASDPIGEHFSSISADISTEKTQTEFAHSSPLPAESSRVSSRLKLSRIIPLNALRRLNDYYQGGVLIGMTGGAAAHELFLADYENTAVRAFDTRSDTLDATDAYRSEMNEIVHDVAYSAESDTLFVGTCNYTTRNFDVRSFGRTNSNQWNERHRMTFPNYNSNRISLRVLRDGTLFYGQWNTNRVHVCREHAHRSLQNCTHIKLPTLHRGFDVQRVGNETRLAAALANGSVALFRVDTNGVHQLSIVPLAGARDPLFVGDTLLVLSLNGMHTAADTFSTTGGGLQRHDRQLIAFDARLAISSWCFANGSLFAFDVNSHQIFVYNAV